MPGGAEPSSDCSPGCCCSPFYLPLGLTLILLLPPALLGAHGCLGLQSWCLGHPLSILRVEVMTCVSMKVCAGKPVPVPVTQHLSFARMLLFFFFFFGGGEGMGKSLGIAMTDVLAHPSSAAGCSMSFLAPSCQETAACPKQTTLQIPSVTLPKPSVFFVPDAECPCACVPSPGELLP